MAGFDMPNDSDLWKKGVFLLVSDLAGAPADEPSAEAVAAEEAFAEQAPAEATAPEGAPEHGGNYSGFGADFGGASVPTGDAAASVGDLSFVGGELMGVWRDGFLSFCISSMVCYS